MIAVPTAKIYPAANPFFCCATQWFQIFAELAKNMPFKKDLYKVIMLFPDLSWLVSKMQGQNHPRAP